MLGRCALPVILSFMMLLVTACNGGSADRPEDKVSPTIVLNGPSEIEIVEGRQYIEQGATATDDVDGSITVAITGTVDTSQPGDYEIRYAAVDAAGNSSEEIRLVQVTPLGWYTIPLPVEEFDSIAKVLVSPSDPR